jgi:glycine cleavage system aminomethyltransferase T
LLFVPSSAPSPQPGPIDDLLRGAGARMHLEHGAMLPADFGSSAGELAVCMRSVGIGLLDESEGGESFAIVGPRAAQLVKAAGLEGGPATVSQETPMYFSVSVLRDDAREVWRSLMAAGSALGAGLVGSTAIHNFLVQTQLHSRQLGA